LTSSLSLKIAVANYPHTVTLKEGRIPIRGVDAEFVNVQPQIAAFRRMVRDVEFDVCELAPTTYIIARSFGAPFMALPVFLMRSFHHGALLVRPDAGIKGPKDLEGKKVGVRAYSVTTGVWARGILIDEYGLDSSKVTWVVDDEEHVTQLKLPANVVHAPEGRSLAKMMRDGELQAGFAANAGIGREGAPTAGWDKGTAATAPSYPNLFPNAAELEAEWYGRTKIYPMHGTLVVKDSVLAEHSWVAESLFEAFTRAKEEWLARVRSGEADTDADRKITKVCPIVGPDPLPQGLEQNLPTIRALESYAWKQALISRRMSVEELFVDPASGVKRDQLNLVM
jgi:4,5-dihydroxyphthalate decarboxylase